MAHKKPKMTHSRLQIREKIDSLEVHILQCNVHNIFRHILNIIITSLLIKIWSLLRFIVARQRQTCLVRSCNQLIIGRRLRYGRVLAIINNEEYLKEVRNLGLYLHFTIRSLNTTKVHIDRQ